MGCFMLLDTATGWQGAWVLNQAYASMQGKLGTLRHSRGEAGPRDVRRLQRIVDGVQQHRRAHQGGVRARHLRRQSPAHGVPWRIRRDTT